MGSGAMVSIQVFILIILFVEIYSLEVEVAENKQMVIKCEQNEGIQINEAKWRYERLNLRNSVFSPNLGNLAYLWGTYLGMCTWDVSKIFRERCAYNNECIFTPTRAIFGNCSYEMILQVDYECKSNIGNSYQLKKKMHCFSVDSDGKYCFNTKTRQKRQGSNNQCSRVENLNTLAHDLETNPVLITQQRTDMGAVTSTTICHFPRSNGSYVDLVLVMRARISSNTIQPRQGFPSGVTARMAELNTIPRSSGASFYDDRGHLLASTLGGPSHRLNIVPQHSELNRHASLNGFSFWIQIEGDIRRIVANNPGSYVDWLIVVNYANRNQDNLRPTQFALDYIVHYANGASTTWSTNWMTFSNDIANCEIDFNFI